MKRSSAHVPALEGGRVAVEVRQRPLWRQAIHSALDADRFDLEDWAAARTTIPALANYDDRRRLKNSAVVRCRMRS